MSHDFSRRDFVKSSAAPLPPSVGQQAAISGHMATLSFKAGKKIVWDDHASLYHFV